jgi:iron complex transport system permease protein
VTSAAQVPPVGRTERRVTGVRPAAGLAGVVGLLVLLAVSVVLSLTIGSGPVSLSDVWQGVFSPDRSVEGQLIVQHLRIPRTVAGLLAGAALGLAGAVIQGVTRNPLADPGLLGINAGASAAVVLAIGWLGITAANGYIWFGFLGAAVAATLVYGIGSLGREGATPVKLTSSQVTVAQDALIWLTGSLNGASLEAFWPLLGSLVVLLPLTALAARPLPVLQLGDATAAGLGVPVERSRRALLACAVGLTGVAVAAAGPVAFVAFVAGPVARRLIPTKGAALVQAALVGALLMLVADFAAQHLLWSTQFPVGVVTSLIGAPYLLWLLSRANRIGKGG